MNTFKCSHWGESMCFEQYNAPVAILSPYTHAHTSRKNQHNIDMRHDINFRESGRREKGDSHPLKHISGCLQIGYRERVTLPGTWRGIEKKCQNLMKPNPLNGF